MLSAIANTFLNCFKIPELKARILFTLVILVICRLIALITIPGLNGAALHEFFQANSSQGGGVLGLYSMFTGGALERCAVGSLGIMPYISATIIIQLLGAVIPSLAKMRREQDGHMKIIKYGRYLTVVICLVHGFVMTLGWEHPEKILPGFSGQLVLSESIWWYRIQTVLILTTGTMLLMWFGEQITDRGIGNGISLIITVGILARLPQAAQSLYFMFFPPEGESQFNLFHGIFLIGLLATVIAGVIAVTQAQRKIPVQHAQRAVGRKVYAGGSSFLPLRVNYAGVMPIIFAQAILLFPQMLFNYIGQLSGLQFFEKIAAELQTGTFLHVAVVAAMIIFFTYFWVATQFNELEISDNLKRSGAYIPGVRPGPETVKFLHRTMSRITLAGACFLVVIAVIPDLLTSSMGINYAVSTFFGGTSILITVGVLLDTMRQIESHLLMRHYDGFLKKGRIKGRF